MVYAASASSRLGLDDGPAGGNVLVGIGESGSANQKCDQ
jgi:hypothetical protein